MAVMPGTATGYTRADLREALGALWRAEERVTAAFDALDDARTELKHAKEHWGRVVAFLKGGDDAHA